MTPEQVAARLAGRARDALASQQEQNQANPARVRVARRGAEMFETVAVVDDPVLQVRVSELLVLCDAVGVSVPVAVDERQGSLWEVAS